MRIISIAIFLIFFVSTGFAQNAFDLETKNSALSSSDGYRQRPNDDRYEGLYTKKVSSQIELLSLTIGKVQYDLTEDEKIIIQAPAAIKDKTVGVTGKSFLLNKYYRFDLLVNGKKKKEVPVKEIIGKKFIYSDNLGIYGYLGESNSPVTYVPVRVSSAHFAGSEELSLVLLSNAPQEKVQWKYAATTANGDCLAYVDGSSIPGGPSFAANKPIVIPLSFPKSIKSGTILCLSIDFQSARSKQWENKSFKMIMP